MLRLFWNALKASPVIFSAFFLVVNNAFATQTLSEETIPGRTIAAITEKSIASVKSAAEPYTQPPQKLVKESNFFPLIFLETSSSLEVPSKPIGESDMKMERHRYWESLEQKSLLPQPTN